MTKSDKRAIVARYAAYKGLTKSDIYAMAYHEEVEIFDNDSWDNPRGNPRDLRDAISASRAIAMADEMGYSYPGGI